MTEVFFFKEGSNDAAAEFKRCLPLGVQTSFITMRPALMTAEELRIKPLLGESLFERAAAHYASDETDEVLDRLVELIQMAELRLACYGSFAQLAVMMTDAGISNTQGEKRAYRYETDALRESLHRQGYEYVNKILEFCGENVESLPEFTESQYYSSRSASVIKGLKDFEKFVSLGGDFSVFAKLREWIEEAETMELPFRVGSTIAESASGGTLEDGIVLRGIKAFVAHWAIAEAAPFLSLAMSPHGLIVVSEESAGSVSGKVSNPPRPEQVSSYINYHRAAAENYIGKVVLYCKQHADEYPGIAEIGDKETEHEADIVDNSGKKTFLAL